MTIQLIIAVLLATGYFILQMRYVKNWQLYDSFKVPEKFDPNTHITILIPARNEADNIAACLKSISRQNYPKNLLNIIVISDHSDDQTLQVAKKAAQKFGFNSKKIQFVESIDNGKKAALQQSIQLAQNEWIITIDADVILNEHCLRYSAWMRESMGAEIVTGPVLIQPNKSVLEYFQALDQAGLMLITGAGYVEQEQLLANGAFLSFSKKAFDSVQGYKGNEHFASGDDLFLVEKISQLYPGKAYFLKSADAVAYTRAEEDWQSLIRQRVRWASKNKGLKGRKLQFVWGFVWVYCIAIICMMLASFVNPLLFFLPGIILIGMKMLADHLMLSEAVRFFRKDEWMQHFFLSEITHIFYVSYVGIKSLLGGKYNWKGRDVK